MRNEIKPSQKGKHCDSIPCERVRVVKILETEKRMRVARGWRCGSRESLFNGSSVSVLQDVKNYEDGCGGDGHTTSYVYLLPLNWVFKNC